MLLPCKVITVLDIEGPVLDRIGDIAAGIGGVGAAAVRILVLGLVVAPLGQLLVLEDDFALQFLGRRQHRLVFVDRGDHQHVSEHVLECLGHLALLGQAAVVLDRKDDWVVGGYKTERALFAP